MDPTTPNDSAVVRSTVDARTPPLSRLEVVAIALIHVGENEVRGAEDDPELPALAASIVQDGLIEPLLLDDRDGELHLVAGHRRYSACILARVSHVPCTIQRLDSAQAKRISFAENFHRKDLSPYQQASAIAEAVTAGFVSVEDVAKCFRRSVEWVKDQLAILEWPEDVLVAVHSRSLSVSAAGNLAKITDPVYRDFLIRTAVESGATARATSGWLQGWAAQQPADLVVSQPAPAGPGLPAPVLPLSLCIGCRGEFSPQGMVPVYLCPVCVNRTREQGDSVKRR